MSRKTAGDAGTAALAAARSALQPDPAVAAVADEAAISALARQRARRRRLLIWAARAATLVIIIGGWQLFTSWKIVDPFFFGQPSGIWHQLTDWARNGTQYGSIWLQVWITMKEALLGFVLGVAAGIVFGVLLGQVRFLADVLGPYIKAMNALPRIVLGSIFVVWLGLGTTSKVMLAAVLVFFVVFFNAFQGVREVDRNFIAGARVLGASRAQITRHVVLPSALTWIIASLHVAFGFAIIGAIVGEFLGAQKGLGLVIATAQNNFNPDGVFAAMLIIAILALTAEGLIGQLERRLLSWRPPAGASADAAIATADAAIAA
jgi:NitT/TauT family transport system permease protein